MGTTRALIISQTQKRLEILGAGLDTTDTPAGDFHYPLNYALTRMQKTDSDVVSFTTNEERIAVIGTEYYVLTMLAKKYYGLCDEEGRKQFNHILQLLRLAASEFMKALNGDDIPDSADEVAEEIAIWGSTDRQPVDEFDSGGSAKDAPFHINEFGSDESDYLENDDEDW